MTARKLIPFILLVPACAVMERHVESPEPHATAMVELRPSRSPADTRQVVPGLLGAATLPSAARLSAKLLANRDHYDLGVRICVSPAGDVAGVDLTQASGDAALDVAALHDIRAWHYEAMPGPATLRTCMPITIRYQP